VAFCGTEAEELAFASLGAFAGELAWLAPEEQPVKHAVNKMGTK
jgi:hypothetical protein